MKTKVLPCGCHKVTDSGRFFSRIEQYSKRGHQGIITNIRLKWRELHPVKTAKGYRQVVVHGRAIRLNRLVATNFVPNPEAYPECQHIDGDKENNAASNLKWGTAKHNADDRNIHGHSVRGERSPNAKLNEGVVRKIRSLRSDGRTFLSIAKRFNVSKKLVMLVVQRKIWRHVA